MKETLKKITVGLTLLLTLPFIIWNLTFGLWVSLLLVGALVGGIVAIVKSRNYKRFYLFVLTGFVGYLVLLPVTTYQLNKKQEVYYSIIKSGGELNTVQKFNVYGFHGIMVLTGAVLYPELSMGAALMMFPNGNDELIHNNGDHRTIDGLDFFMKSEKLMKHFETHNEGHFTWKLADYKMSSPESRIALTINPLDFKITETANSRFYELTVPMHYHKGVDVLFKSKLVTIQAREDLFWYLARRGWLHEYWLTYTYTEMF